MPDQSNSAFPGVFITLEGGDGAGKTTHATRLAEHLAAHGREVVRVHEPGGTKLGEQIRALLLDAEQVGMDPHAELLLYEAARAQLIAEVVAPALEAGKVVISDRFTDSTIAYQGYGRDLGPELVHQLNMVAAKGVCPDRSILMALTPEDGLRRALKRSGSADRMEQAGEEFHRKVYQGFEDLAAIARDRVRIVDATLPKPQVQLDVFAAVADLFEDIPAPDVSAR